MVILTYIYICFNQETAHLDFYLLSRSGKGLPKHTYFFFKSGNGLFRLLSFCSLLYIYIYIFIYIYIERERERERSGRGLSKA